MDEIPSATLRKIGEDVITLFKKDPHYTRFIHKRMKNYHGFLKAALPREMIRDILSRYELVARQEEVEIEVVTVLGDQIEEAHFHALAHAWIMIVGQNEHFHEPEQGFAVLGNELFPVVAGQIIDVPPGTVHTVTVRTGGILTFLSVQAPAIERIKNGEPTDDYYRVESVSITLP